MARRRPLVSALVLVALLSAACTGHPDSAGSARTSVASGASSSGAPVTDDSAADDLCPAKYRAPDPHRPTVLLTFDVSADLSRVHGTEHISFTPDRPITELVFRLTANSAPSVKAGTRIVVTSASGDYGAGAATYTADGAGAGSQGALLHLPYASTIPAGTTVTADLTFDLTLAAVAGTGAQSFDRFGHTGVGAQAFAWFASAQPLLAWERGFGWHTEPTALFPAESTTSEAMQTDLTVRAPSALTVALSGGPGATSTEGAPKGQKIWHTTLATARDVSVAVGPFSTTQTKVGDTTLFIAAPTSGERDTLVPLFTRAITQLVQRFGPFPFPSLSVALLPGKGGGIEYPSSVLLFNTSELVAVHETAHQYFYAMVGDSQATHPWLDEAFATYAQEEVDNVLEPTANVKLPGSVDSTLASWGSDSEAYYLIVYYKGAAALEAARAAAGADAFDAALRCYVRANAWRIANPSDVAAALAGLPAALTVLRDAKAFS